MEISKPKNGQSIKNYKPQNVNQNNYKNDYKAFTDSNNYLEEIKSKYSDKINSLQKQMESLKKELITQINDIKNNNKLQRPIIKDDGKSNIMKGYSSEYKLHNTRKNRNINSDVKDKDNKGLVATTTYEPENSKFTLYNKSVIKDQTKSPLPNKNIYNCNSNYDSNNNNNNISGNKMNDKESNTFKSTKHRHINSIAVNNRGKGQIGNDGVFYTDSKISKFDKRKGKTPKKNYVSSVIINNGVNGNGEVGTRSGKKKIPPKINNKDAKKSGSSISNGDNCSKSTSNASVTKNDIRKKKAKVENLISILMRSK